MANRPNHSLNNDQIIARPATPVPPPINRNQQQEICSTKSTDNPGLIMPFTYKTIFIKLFFL